VGLNCATAVKWTDGSRTMDDVTAKIGLLMESVHSQQQLARDSIDRLDELTRHLDEVVRAEIRETLVDELRNMRLEVDRSMHALRGLRRSVALRFGATGLMLLTLAGGVTTALIGRFAPSESELQALRARRDALVANIGRLEQRGGRLQWRLCGDQSRLCVQIDSATPAFGAHADYRIVKGY